LNGSSVNGRKVETVLKTAFVFIVCDFSTVEFVVCFTELIFLMVFAFFVDL